jgi:hypothetical protein
LVVTTKVTGGLAAVSGVVYAFDDIPPSALYDARELSFMPIFSQWARRDFVPSGNPRRVA